MASVMTCRVHPTVLMSIVDAHERRSTKEDKAIGALLGHYDKRVIEVTNCYSVPFSESKGDPEIDVAFNQDMYDMTRKALATGVPVGWFSTNSEINEHSLSYHDFYTDFARVKQEKRDPPPVMLLTVDTAFENNRMNLRAFLRTKAGIPGAKDPHCAIFLPITVEVTCFETEETALDLVTAGVQHARREVQLFNGVQEIGKVTDQMLKWIEQTREYVDDVLKGKTAPDSAIGRRLIELVNSVGRLQPQQFSTLLNSNIKDYLMISYLAQLAKTQLTLHQKMLSA